MATTKIPFNKGTLPNWNRQTDNPRLFNMFIDKEGNLNFTPGLDLFASLPGTRAIWESPYDGGSYIVVTQDAIWRIKDNGSRTKLYGILNSDLHVEMTENTQNQVTIVDGKNAYVVDQRMPMPNVTVLGSGQGFTLTNPGSCCIINSFTVILDIDSGVWTLSKANNALLYDPAALQLIDPQLEFPLAVRNINNNLFIFGSAGIERWEPTLNVNVYLFPLQKDMNFKVNFGAVSTQCIVSNINTIYFLSSRFTPMQLTAQGCIDLPLADKSQDVNGIAKVFSEYPDISSAIGSFYTLRGNYFYQLTFPTSEDAWVYCVNSGTFANIDDYIIGSAFTSEVVIKSDGVYNLSLYPATKKRALTLENIEQYLGVDTYRNILSAVELRQAAGADSYPLTESLYPKTSVPEYIALSVSLDRKSFGNSVRIPIGNVGQRNYRTIWRTNLTGQYFTLKFEYCGDYPLTIESVYATIN